MLNELRVRDLGVIRDVTVELGAGMTALTGETGAGKTLLVQALQLVLGVRASSDVVRAGSDEALVEARFGGVPASPGDSARRDEDLADDTPADAETETTLCRAVAAGGRSRAWVNGRVAPVSALAEIAPHLVDIHGQHDQQSILGSAGQRAALDHFAGADHEPLTRARRELALVEARMAEIGGDERERARRKDLLRYQAEEIDSAQLADAHEEEALLAEEARLADLTELRRAAAHAALALSGDEGPDGIAGGATGMLGLAVTTLAGWRALAPWEERLRSALTELDDVAAELRRAAETWEDDPTRLQAVQERRRLLADLRKKYGATLADVVAFGAEVRRSLAELEHQEEEAATLVQRRAVAQAGVDEAERELRAVRAGAAPVLAAAVTERLRSLAMPDARFEVTVGDSGPGDAVQFLLGANRGEPLAPLSKVASGGELSRAMLALRLVVEGGAPTMLFDEVDAGVGGSAALALARALREVACRRQVLVVTHLPQVAAFADHQLAVRKAVDDDGRTVTSVHPLGADERVVELSRMLSGHPDSATARAHAQELLGRARAGGSTTPARGHD